MIRNDNYYIIQGWMQNELKLKGNELRVYAIIYGFSQNGESEFRGSINYISEFLDVSYKTVCRTLASLTAKGYVNKSIYNSSQGSANGYSCVPLDEIKATKEEKEQADVKALINHILDEIIADYAADFEATEEEIAIYGTDFLIEEQDVVGRTKCPTLLEGDAEGTDKMSYPVGQNVPPYILSYNIQEFSNEKNKEENNSKKESKKIRNNLTNESTGSATFHLAERRKKKLPSYQEVMNSFKVDKGVQIALWEFIRHCQLNGRKLTNSKLEGIAVELDMQYRDDECGKIQAIHRAINGGYFDIRRDMFL